MEHEYCNSVKDSARIQGLSPTVEFRNTAIGVHANRMFVALVCEREVRTNLSNDIPILA